MCLCLVIGGEGGIRTHGGRESSPDFESGTFDHSATSPGRQAAIFYTDQHPNQPLRRGFAALPKKSLE